MVDLEIESRTFALSRRRSAAELINQLIHRPLHSPRIRIASAAYDPLPFATSTRCHDPEHWCARMDSNHRGFLVSWFTARRNQPLCHSRNFGGTSRDRTDDILLAKQALSHLSYGPMNGCESRDRTGGVFRRRVMSPLSCQLLTISQKTGREHWRTVRISNPSNRRERPVISPEIERFIFLARHRGVEPLASRETGGHSGH